MLDTRRQRKDGTYPIIIRLGFNRKTTSISTGYAVKETEWDSRKLKVKRSNDKADIINDDLLLLITDFNKKLLSSTTNFDSINDIKSYLLGNYQSTDNFVFYTRKVIKSFIAEDRYGNAKAYDNAILFLHKYLKNSDDIKFTDITPQVLKHIEAVFIGNGYSYNGLSFNFRTIRAIFNRAIAEGVISADIYPFRRSANEKNKYKIKNEKTIKRAITKADIILLENYLSESKPFSSEFIALSYFLFSFYCRGINLTDMAYLTRKNIENGYLIYRRRKTHVLYKVKLTQKALKILEDFKGKGKKDYLFPIIKRKGQKYIHYDIYNANRTTNKYLKIIANKLGIKVNITMYVARHTWATIADRMGIDRRIISQGLGHTSLTTTEIYINDIVSSDDLAAADELITG